MTKNNIELININKVIQKWKTNDNQMRTARRLGHFFQNKSQQHKNSLLKFHMPGKHTLLQAYVNKININSSLYL